MPLCTLDRNWEFHFPQESSETVRRRSRIWKNTYQTGFLIGEFQQIF